MNFRPEAKGSIAEEARLARATALIDGDDGG